MSLRAIFQQHRDLTIGLLLALLGALIYLPYLGSFPLWDPWEPHYSQVAWEMQRRHTWFEPFYRNLDNWWSKPILMLWLLRASFGLFWDSQHAFARHELYARLPFALLAILGGIGHYDWVGRLYGRRVGAMAAVVLLTTAQYLLIGRQVMADMAMVIAYSNAMGYLAVGLFTHGNAQGLQGQVRQRRFARLPQHWPWLMFWSLQALAVLAKGFVAPTLAILTLGSYGLLTFRAGDYAEPARQPHWASYAVKRGAITLLLLSAVALAIRTLLRHAGLAKEQRELAVAIVVAIATLGMALGVFADSAPSRHARAILVRMRAHWGIPLFLALAAPWYLYMTARHGWPYWRTFIFFHHLGRAAGEINLPTGSFEYYLRSLGFALFPWTGFLVGGLVVFLGRCQPAANLPERRNLYVLCLLAAPLAFFMLSGTKFAHYVFPLVPGCTVIIATTLVWLTARGDDSDLVSERTPGADAERPLRPANETRGTLAVVGFLALLVFVVLLSDVRHDVRHLLRLFVYYFNRPTPFEYQPARMFGLLGLPVAIVTGLLLLSRYVSRWHLATLGASAVIFACYLGWVTMPAMGATYSYRPVYDAYRACAKPGDAIGQYNNWPQPERSVIFLFQNQALHLNSDAAAALFLTRPGRKFVIVDHNRLADLRRVARQVNVPLHVVFDDHPYARLVSTEPSPAGNRNQHAHVFGELPVAVTPSDANFDGKIRLLGWRATPESLRPGESVQIAFYFEATSAIERNWKILAHADNAAVTGHRLVLDHDPVFGTRPTSSWQEGRIIEDVFTLQVPVDYPFESFFVWTGFFIGDERLPLSNNPPNDGLGRVRGPLVFVTQTQR
jgi:4-amino-4-deoxy-L-arabinose transferase-like glycosyltransferase